MDDAAWTALAAAGCALAGAAFGALAGALSWRAGNATGTSFGLAMLRGLERFGRRELTSAWRGAVVGGSDGALFMGALGLGLALVGGDWSEAGRLRAAFAGLLAIMGGAAAFGLLAYVMLRFGGLALVGVIVGGILGGGAAVPYGPLAVPLGALAGSVLVLGGLVGLLAYRGGP